MTEQRVNVPKNTRKTEARAEDAEAEKTQPAQSAGQGDTASVSAQGTGGELQASARLSTGTQESTDTEEPEHSSQSVKKYVDGRSQEQQVMKQTDLGYQTP